MINFKNIAKSNMADDSNDSVFIKKIFDKGIEPYTERLLQYGFNEHEKVLDAGCGFGQWSLALSQINKEIYSCDADIKRVNFLKKVSSDNQITNVSVKQALIDNLPYESECFDAVFCYSVIFVTPWKKSLYELIRVLKPGGKLYVNANGFGWYKHLWYSNHNQAPDYSPRKVASEVWLNTYRYNEGLNVDFPQQLIIEPTELIAEMKSLGLENINYDGEGLLGNPKNKGVFFQKEYFGDIGVYEIMGIKK
jgi:ubiquinone/menaquinone biosynthesis C-methylase UbiE